MNESDEIRMMRVMAWERAKGELLGVLNTYINNESFEPMNEAVEKFIELVEGEGLQE